MPDVFVSYSRRDTEFVRGLVDGLAERGKDVWLDTEGIADGEVFPEALKRAIESSAGFVFVISPESARSPYCAQEVELALELNKRIVPVVHEPVADDVLPEGIRVRNWIHGDPQETADRVSAALDHDLEHVRAHTRWGSKAIEWDQRGRDKSLLLRGSELSAAEAWLSGAAGKDPEPTEQQREYVRAAFGASRRRQRAVTAFAIAVAAVALVLVVVALVSRQQAQREREAAETARSVATSRQLAAQADAQRSADPELAVLLARRALQTAQTPDALRALRDALDASPVRARLPPTGVQGCPQTDMLAYAPAGSVLAQGECRGVVRLLDPATQRVLRSRKVASTVSQLTYGPDGRRLAVATPDAVLLLDAETLATVRTLPSRRPFSVTVAGGGSVAAAERGGVRIFDRGADDGGRLLRSIRRPGSVTRVRFVDAGRNLLVGRFTSGGADALEIVQTATGRVVRSAAPSGNVADVAIRPDGREAAVSFESQRVEDENNYVQRFRLPDLVPLPGRIRSGGRVIAVAYSPDGKRLVLANDNGDMTVDDAVTGATILELNGQTVAASSVAFSPDGRQVASYADDGTARLWDAREIDPVFARTDDPIVEIAFDDSGRLWATTEANEARAWDARTGRPRERFGYSLPAGPTLGLGIEGKTLYVQTADPDRYLVKALPSNRTIGAVDSSPYWSGGSHTRPGSRQIAMLRIDPKTGALVRPALFDLYGERLAAELDGPAPRCAGGWGWGKWAPDGETYVAGTVCGQLMVWDAGSGRQVWRTTLGGATAVQIVSPDGETLAVGGADSTITVFSLAEQRKVRVLAGHERGVGALAFSPDGRRLVSTGDDKTIKVFDTRSWNLLRRIPLAAAAEAYALVLSPDGRRIFAADRQGTIRSYALCPNCGDAGVLLREAEGQITRDFTAIERTAFLTGG